MVDGLAFLRGKACVACVGLGVFEVDFLVSNVHVSADDNGFLFIQPLEVHAEILFPAHAVHQPRQAALTVGRIDRDEIKRIVFECNQPPFVVVQLTAHAVLNGKRLLFGENRRTGIALLFRRIKEFQITRRGNLRLPGLHFGFLQTEEIGVLLRKIITEALRQAGAQTVDVSKKSASFFPPSPRRGYLRV